MLELAVVGSPLRPGVVEHLVEALSAYSASGLHTVDRYAIQLIVEADGPLFALQKALTAHAGAIVPSDLRCFRVVHTEVMTVGELERGWQSGAHSLVFKEPQQAWEYSRTMAAEVHGCGRALLRAASTGQLRQVLVDFVRRTGADLHQAGHPRSCRVDIDLSLGHGRPLYPTAEPFSTSRLLLEEALPSLVEDAHRILGLLTASAHLSDECAAESHPRLGA